MTTAKRALDVAIAGLGLIVLAPLLGLLALVIRLESPGPVLYRGLRAGQAAKPFRIFKFRTMYQDADRRGGGITVRNDPRVTRVGRVLRRTKLDELPQLLNVLRGEMSLVGPRPEDPRYLAYYSPAQCAVLQVPPGITSAASIAFRDEEALLDGADWESRYINQVLPRKLELELEYLNQRSFWSDVRVLFKTLFALF